jgi:hypothetical protein
MPLIDIKPVTREGTKLLISLFGLSETGKTYSALKLMAGIEPDPRKRGLLDSEGGNRGRMYMDVIEGGYLYGALTPPFTVERYIEALRDFVDAGVTTLCIDSISHVWNAEGGILDMADQSTGKGQAKWAAPKRRLAKLTGAWMHCGLHLILCARGKQPLIDGPIVDGKKTLVPGPIVPIQERSLRFDLTVMALMLGDGEFSIDRQHGGKCPGMWRPIFAAGNKMDEAMGQKLIAWIGGHDATTPEQRRLQMDARDKANEGMAAYQAFFKGLTKAQREALLPQHENLKSIAKSADDEAARLAAEKDEAATETDLDAPFAGPDLANGVAPVGSVAPPTVHDDDAFQGDRP